MYIVHYTVSYFISYPQHWQFVIYLKLRLPRVSVSSSIMGCQLGMTKREPDEIPKTELETETLNLLSLPNEVLVNIMLCLPDSRDRVKLRYVSRKLRSISETPSLWREFVWPDCNPREEKRLKIVMKSCGMHIRRLSFHHLNQPSVLPASSQTALKLVEISIMTKILQYCSNLTHLSLPALGDLNSRKGNFEQLRESIQEMKYLEMLTIYCHADSIQLYLNLQTALKELTIHTVVRSKNDVKAFQNWMTNGFTPPNLNIVVHKGSMYGAIDSFRKFLLPAWPVWNSQIPAGRIACIRLYNSYKAPQINLFQDIPVFQVQYGETAVPPFVKGQSIGVPEWLMLTDRNGKMMSKAKVYREMPVAIYEVVRNYEQDSQLVR